MSGENDVTPVARAEFLRLLEVQEAKGVETYGVTLQAGNGRDALQDAAEELVDAFKYFMQARMENATLRAELDLSRSVYQSALEASELQIARLLEQDADLVAAREREQRLVDALSDLRRGCMVGSGRACRLCLGSWVDDETIEDHHPWCPMGPTVELFRAAAASSAVAQEPRGEGV